MSDNALTSSRRFGGIARLYGDSALTHFSQAHVCVVGVGGVGSWAVEALARTGIGRLTLIDLDNVAESNANRQLHALTGDFGKAKLPPCANVLHKSIRNAKYLKLKISLPKTICRNTSEKVLISSSTRSTKCASKRQWRLILWNANNRLSSAAARADRKIPP